MVKGIFDEMSRARPRRRFTIGIRRRCDPHQPGLRPLVFDRGPGHGARGLLRPGRRRNGGGQQELHQDHRRGDGQLRPGLFRLRLEEIRIGDGVPSPFRAAAHPLHVPHQPRHVRGLPSVLLPRAPRRAAAGRAGRGVPGQYRLWSRRGLGPSAPGRAGADHRQGSARLRHRRQPGGARGGHGRARQHRDADLLLRHQRRASARRGDCRHQAFDREDVRQARRGGGAEELGGGGQRPRAPGRSDGTGPDDERGGYSSARAGRGARVRSARDGQDDRGGGGFAARERDAFRRHLSHRDGAVGEARTSRSRSPRGTRRCASSAGSACSSARTR